MSVFDPAFSASVKDSTTALVGIAQVRIATSMSIRPVGTGTLPTAALTQAVGSSFVIADASDPTQFIVKPVAAYVPNTYATNPATPSGTYVGVVDGCFIIRPGDVATSNVDGATLTAAGKVNVWAPDGTMSSVTLTGGAGTTGVVQGVTIALAFGVTPTAKVGDTWVIPVISGSAQSGSQTGIVSPYSLFKGSTNSCGGLTSSSFDPVLDTVAKLESGFPSSINDQIIAKVSAGLKFNCQEFGNPVVSTLRYIANAAIATGDIVAVAAEIVFRQRSGNLITYWCPSCTMPKVPTIAAKNDFSDVAWELSVNKQVQNSATGAYAAWLRNTPLYFELQYTH